MLSNCNQPIVSSVGSSQRNAKRRRVKRHELPVVVHRTQSTRVASMLSRSNASRGAPGRSHQLCCLPLSTRPPTVVAGTRLLQLLTCLDPGSAGRYGLDRVSAVLEDVGDGVPPETA